ncbi:hypothetical protein NEOLEDRAFT_1136341 [Neolentinus lepideus HHB14362 ss-1]|uniref:Uncharacterized protein n=1 Tax=Neolentinus lepideus HHB14362 ss-1 TaxID=1314782 RepID=A0A165RB21_9AGAM|nr:hypothetical protein NEOLEDRAFT_1136341 [Neolentinus lepideus HHB14362 ss-1]
MSTPYRTPNVRLPSTPNPTPATSYLKRPINLKPPIHNPYDKFTASEFNAWVSDLKGALRKALGQEDEASRATEEEEVELELEDSFAEYKTRRSAKGKGRDPREGPGLAAGVNWVSHVADTPSEDAATDDEVANLERESEEEEEEEEEEEDDEDRRPVLVTLNGEGSSGQPIELLSEDEDRVSPQPSKHHADDDDLYEWSDQEERSTPDIADPWNGPRTYAEDFYAGDDSRGASALAPEEDEEGGLVLTPDIGAEDEIIDVDADEDDERQDFYPAYVWLSSKDDGEQDGEEDTEFTRDGTPQIADPWEGPRMYMEDFYAGGDRIDRGALSDPSNLTPRYEESEVIELASDDDETDTSQGGPFSDAYTNAMNASHLREHEITEGPQSHRDFAFQVLQAHEDSVRQETPFLLPEMGSYSHKPAPASLPRARSKTPSIAPNGHVDWSWPPAFPIDGATLSADASEAVGELQIPEHPEQDRGQQPPGVDADAVAESAAEAAVSAAAPENGGEAAQAIAAEIEANLRKFDETVIQAALDAANASAAETEAMEAMVDFGAENVGADGMMDEEHDEAFDRATQESALASFEALIDAQNAEILDAAETSDESAVAVAAELQIDEEPREVEIAPEQNGAEYAVEEQDVDEQEVDELEGDDVVSVSASEYAARASQAREYTVEELRSEPRCSEVPEESLSIDASLAEDVEKSSEQAAEVDATQVKIAIAESHLETSSDKDQIDIAPTSPQTVPEERTVEELEATTEAAASSIDVVVFGDVSVDSTQDNFPEQPEETAEPSLIPDRTQEVPSTEVDADTSTIEAVPLHDLPELEVSLHDEPPARLQAEQVELAPASSPSRIPAGVPLPVMASPEVPDPASVGHTPGTVTPMTNIPPIMAGPALSSAGLFTPLGERSMGTTPEPDGNEESLQVPAEHNVAQVVDATPVQPIEGDMDENNISGFATVSEEPSVTTKPSDTEPITQCIAEEPETSRIVSPQENVASDLADADSSMEHSTTQSVNLHHPSQPMLHADPYPYSLSTPTLETSMTGFFDPQPTTSVSRPRYIATLHCTLKTCRIYASYTPELHNQMRIH